MKFKFAPKIWNIVHVRICLYLFVVFLFSFTLFAGSPGLTKETGSSGLSIAIFDIDVTPPIGSHMAYDPVMGTWDMGLRARGIVLSGAGLPIVLCSFDWIGIANESQDEFKKAFAEAAGTIPERVAVHTVHQHDAPVCNFGAEKILKEAGIDPSRYESTFTRQVMQRLADEIKASMSKAQTITHIGLGEAPVFNVASNRRIKGPDGKVRATRYTACGDSALRAEPEGVIDPIVSLVSFWNNDKPVAVLSYYASHPQSYYRTGLPNPDFPGIARFYRQLAVPEALHVHFNGAGGNIGAGKYNDGSKVNRGILAERLADGMKRAWDATKKEAITPETVKWNLEKVTLPPSTDLENLKKEIVERSDDVAFVSNTLPKIAWLNRCQQGIRINIGCLSLGRARILFMPGELFVEYQLAAKAERPDLFVAMAAYGDYGPGYICTDIAYSEEGYEAGPASGVAPGSEEVLMTAVKNLLMR
ncbi:MAG TPA: hypothetical protein VMV47_00800 [Bacteroidales bacterium]|nr:hypothetical protein [Bacteroidales bacterium]